MENSTSTQLPNENSIRKIGNKQYAIVIIGGLFLFATGLILYSFGFFGKEEKPPTNDSLSDLTPPKSKNTKLEDDKYKKGFSDTQNTLGGGTEELTNITGREPSYPKESNEQLTQEDFEEVKNARKVSSYNRNIPKTEAQSKKEKLNQDFQRKQQQEFSRQQYLARNDAPIFRKTAQELEDERLEREEKEFNNRTAQLVLSNLEKANNPTNNQPFAPNLSKNEEKSIDKKAKDNKPQKVENEINLHPETSQNTIGMKWKKGGFYGFSNTDKQKFYTNNDAITAVIHGQGEAITVQDGSILKLRLLQNTVLQVNEQKITLPMGTLIAGTCRISEERVFITVAALRLENTIYPITIAVFDLDGQQGLYVPNLKEKNILSRELTDAATRPFSGTSVFVPEGSIQKQVGTQIALQSTQSLMQGAKGYFRSKIQSPKVTIKPNYKVLLKSVNLSNINSPANEE
jgi:conjugative transposon TraM protein